jgi:LEA14-like dessication related protein
MRGKKTLVVISILVLLIAGGLWWWNLRGTTSGKKQGTQAVEKLTPKVTVANVSITHMDADKIKAICTVNLENPLPVALNLQGLDYEVRIDSQMVIKDTYSKPISVKSSGHSSVQIPMEIKAKPLARLLKYFDDKHIDSAIYALKATVQVKVPIAGQKSFTFNMDKKLPALRLPKVKAGNIDVEKLGLKRTSMDMVLHVYNPNLFPLKIKDGKYDVTIAQDVRMDGVMEKIINIPAKGSQDVTVTLNMKTGKAGKLAWKMLFDKKDTPYKVDFSCKLMSDSEVLKSSNMAFTMKGTLDQLKDLAKGK